VTTAEIQVAAENHDGAVDKTEYESIVAAHFHAADRDKDGMIDAKKLRTATGRRLSELLK
jgi:hypothetical protein